MIHGFGSTGRQILSEQCRKTAYPSACGIQLPDAAPVPMMFDGIIPPAMRTDVAMPLMLAPCLPDVVVGRERKLLMRRFDS